ncbi:MAG: preprotein translocase subunit SecE [Okeania sp. SIO2F4]|uniref:preprotein translocase subunit SecE n=1 Tax=Microcoleaceae TaxID=1892252 RepID=UPI00142A8B8A|nr:preprotein translocase subunit SecE [Okeania sp. SIO2F4]NES01515.1 preprotein translocase subunit SecE [Okeania sp. SIO2F4]
MAKKEDIRVQENKEGFSPVTFFQETKEELDKVVWPSREQLISESVAVLLMVILSATIIYLVDEFFSWAAGVVFG